MRLRLTPCSPIFAWSPPDVWGTDVVTAGWACSPSNNLLHWGGAAWTPMSAQLQPSDVWPERVSMAPDGTIWISGDNGAAWRIPDPLPDGCLADL